MSQQPRHYYAYEEASNQSDVGPIAHRDRTRNLTASGRTWQEQGRRSVQNQCSAVADVFMTHGRRGVGPLYRAIYQKTSPWVHWFVDSTSARPQDLLLKAPPSFG
jgi:hypothetical protein